MNIVLRALCIVTTTVSLIAQVPFTARQGLSAAQGLGGQQMPSALGTSAPLQSGNALFWVYAFTAQDSLTTVHVVQPQPNNFTATIFPLDDTTGLPIIVKASPLPADIIDSDSAMRIFTANPTYIDWHNQHRVRSEFLLAGRLRSNEYPIPELTPVWVYRAVDSTGTYAVTCVCTHDGSSHGCSSEYLGGGGGGYPFSVHDGLETAKFFAGTSSNPCLVGTYDEYFADTLGKSSRWIYVFPLDTVTIAVALRGIDQDIYQADTEPVEDTNDIEDFPFYIRSNPFAEGWINSTEAMDRFRQHPVYRQFASTHPFEQVPLVGGRIKPNVSTLLNLPVGTAIWLLQYFNNDTLICWCNLEPIESPFVNCYASVLSVSPPDRTQITLAPNPATDHVTIRAREGQIIENVTICDMFGRTLDSPLHSNGSVAQLEIHHLSSGTYFVEVKGTKWIERRLLQVVR
jgi:hypothetical protein